MTLEKPVQRGTGRRARALATLAVAGLVITACSGGGGSSGDTSTVTVTYQQFGGSHVQEQFLTGVKAEFEKANPGVTINLLPITASENDYYTKLQLHDALAEDRAGRGLRGHLPHQLRHRGRLPPAAGRLARALGGVESVRRHRQGRGARRWTARPTAYRTAPTPARSGTTSRSSPRPGLPADWQPKTWDDVLTAARTIKAKVPGVIPLNIYSGKAGGEATSMQGFEMLLYGTGATLYDNNAKKWVIGSKGFKDSLKFIKTVYSEKLGPTPQQALGPELDNTVRQRADPQGQARHRHRRFLDVEQLAARRRQAVAGVERR